MRYWKFGLAAGACAACCAPLLAPLFAGSALVSIGAAGASFFEPVELGMIVLVVGLMAVWFYWRRNSAARLANAKCGCAAASGCNTGTSCDVPKTKGCNHPTASPTQIPTA